MALLSVIVPVYNEAGTIREILEKINAVPVDKEIVVVDDGSTDGTARILGEVRLDNLKVIHHTTNRGKGAAFLTGLSNATSELVIVQDADLEYEPNEYLKLLEAFRSSGADIILGVRFSSGYYGSLIPRMGNRFLTGLMNLLFGVRLNDVFTCYKLFRKETVVGLGLSSTSFTIETEIVAKAVKKKMKIAEVPILYRPRSYAQGKKIRVNDGVRAIFSIIKYRYS